MAVGYEGAHRRQEQHCWPLHPPSLPLVLVCALPFLLIFEVCFNIVNGCPRAVHPRLPGQAAGFTAMRKLQLSPR